MNDSELNSEVDHLKRRVQELGQSMFRIQIVLGILVALAILSLLRGSVH